MKPFSGKILAIGRIFLGLALLVFILFGRDNGIDIGRFLDAAWLFAALPMLALVNGSVEALRLGMLCHSQQAQLGFRHALRLVLVSVFFNFFVPGGTGGDVAKMYYLAADNPGKGLELAVVVFVDRVTGLLGLIITVMLLALINIPLVSDYPLIRWLLGMLAIVLAGVAVSALLIYAGSFRKSRIFRYIRERLPLQHYVGRAAEAVGAFRAHKLALLVAVVISVLGNAVMVLMFLLAGSVFMPDAPSAAVCFLAVLGMFANALPLTPGGLGVGEAAFEGLFGMLGIAAGAMLMVSWRLGMLPLGIVGGLYYITGVRRKLVPEAQYSTGPQDS
jgi:uncharacterized protein (TIRG00374 family)